jgi:nitrate reductase gamma subunit
VRWELYPVKHEPGRKAEYGGSYMEEPNWWEKERKSSLFNEIKYMVPEILLLRGLRRENPGLWNVSFPFHFGIYALIGTLALLVIGAVAMIFGARIAPGNGLASGLLFYVTMLMGSLGLILGTGGSAALLARRAKESDLKNYSALSDYLNLSFFLVFFSISLIAWALHDHFFDGARAYIYSLLTFGGSPAGIPVDRSFLGRLSIVVASLLAAYMPMTHMSHMFMKYFMYHSVRWEDTPNLRGSEIEAAVLKNLGFKPTWAAPHIGADGQKTWADLAAPGRKEGK